MRMALVNVYGRDLGRVLDDIYVVEWPMTLGWSGQERIERVGNGGGHLAPWTPQAGGRLTSSSDAALTSLAIVAGATDSASLSGSSTP